MIFTLITYAVFCILGGLFAGYCLWRLLSCGPFIVGPSFPGFGIAYVSLFFSLTILFSGADPKSIWPGEGLVWIQLILIVAAPRRGETSVSFPGLSEKAFTEVFEGAINSLNLAYENRRSRWWSRPAITVGGVDLYAGSAFMGTCSISANGPMADALTTQIVEAMRARLRKWPEKASRTAYFYLACGLGLSVAIGIKFIRGVAALLG